MSDFFTFTANNVNPFRIGYICIMRKTIFSIFIFIFTPFLSAQFVQIGEGNYLGNFAGPLRTSGANKVFNSRFAYIFPKQVLGNLQHGDTIESLEFFRSDGAAFDTSCKLKMWIGNTSRTTFGATKVSFVSEIASAKQIYSQNPKSHIGSTEAFYKLPFSQKFRFDTSKGENLTLFVEFNQVDTLKGSFNFYFEGSFTVAGYGSQQTHYYAGNALPDSLQFTTEYHPTIRFNYPRFQKDAFVRGVYTLGKIPLPLGNPDSVKVLLKNVGKADLNSFQLLTYTIGKNKQRDSFQVNLKKGEEKFFAVPSMSPSKKGLDTIYVSCNDQNSSNDTGFSYRLGNENIYSYRDITEGPAPGGIGFNGAQGDFVARFQSNISKAINQVSVMFASTGLKFKIGIWSYDSLKARPGKLIYESDSLKTVSGTYTLDLKNPVKVKGSFFVGIRQLDMNNISFGYQIEDPIRPQTFFFAEPLGDTNWIDFHPVAPYRFIIEPRLQADYDIAATAAILPSDTINKYTTDTIAPIGKIKNVGSYKPSDSISVVCEIWGPNTRLYRQVIRDTISPGISRTYTFPKTFFPSELGQHKMLIYSKFKDDQVVDNDTFIKYFYVGLKQDVMVKTIHDPVMDFLTYEYLKDTLQPLATIMNLGYDNSPTFKTRCVILQGKKEIYNNAISLSLPKFQTKILFWPTFKCTDTGKLKVMFITEMTTDKYRYNDTQFKWIVVYKKIDFGLDSMILPLSTKFYPQNTNIPIKFEAFNDGILSIYKMPILIKIYDPLKNLVYLDSVTPDIDGYTSMSFSAPKSFKSPKKGVYTILIHGRTKIDIYPKNDSLKSTFNIGLPYDYEAVKITSVDTMSIGAVGYTLGATIRNNGYLKSVSNCPVIAEIHYNGKLVHNDISNVNLDTSAQSSITFFKKFYPSLPGKYQFLVRTNFVGDMYVKNDTLMKSMFADIGKDAFPEQITLTGGSKYYLGQTLGSTVVKISNQGRDSMKGIQTKLELHYQNKLVKSTFTATDTIAPRGSKDKEFIFNETFAKVGFYSIKAITYHLLDQNLVNDTLEQFLEVLVDRDFAILGIDSPAYNYIYQTKQGMFPRVRISNLGKDSSLKNGKLTMEISSNITSKIWYSDTIDFAQLNPGDSSWVIFKRRLELMEVGLHKVKVYGLNQLDLIPENDTFNSGLIVQLNATIGLSSNREIAVYPNPVKDKFAIKTSAKIRSYRLVDPLGRLVFESQFKDAMDSENLMLWLPKDSKSQLYYLIVDTSEGSFSCVIFAEQ